MSCFLAETVNNPKFPELSKEVKRLKETKGGLDIMCDIMEQYNQEAVDKNERKRIKIMAKKGSDVKFIAEVFDKTVDEVEAILNSSED